MPRPTLLLLACLAAISTAACSTLPGPGPGLASPTPAEQSPDH